MRRAALACTGSIELVTCCRDDRGSGSGGMGNFQPPPLTPPKAPWPPEGDHHHQQTRRSSGSHRHPPMNGFGPAEHRPPHRPPGAAAAAGSGLRQGGNVTSIELVDTASAGASWNSGSSGAAGGAAGVDLERGAAAAANPFGFDSFGRQVAGFPAAARNGNRPPKPHSLQKNQQVPEMLFAILVMARLVD